VARLEALGRAVDAAVWRLLDAALAGPTTVQYAEYAAGGHYCAWHHDAVLGGDRREDRRVLTVNALLAEAPNGAGGSFEVEAEAGGKLARWPVELHEGDAVVFPSRYLRHRVAPLRMDVGEPGVPLRASLVLWLCHGASPFPQGAAAR